MVMMDDGFVGMRHMLTIVFLSGFAGFMEGPVITDVTVAAVCSSPDDACSLAVYLTGFQQVVLKSEFFCLLLKDCVSSFFFGLSFFLLNSVYISVWCLLHHFFIFYILIVKDCVSSSCHLHLMSLNMKLRAYYPDKLIWFLQPKWCKEGFLLFST